MHETRDDTHTNGFAIPTESACILPSTWSQANTQGPREADPPSSARKAGGQAEISPLTVRHPFTCRTNTHAPCRHSHTVSSISAASQQQVSGHRGHLCARLPFFSSTPGHLCWGKTGCEKEQAAGSVSAAVSTARQKHKILLVRINEQWHHGLQLSSFPPILSVLCD